MKWGLIGASTIASQWMIDAFRTNDQAAVKWLVSGSEERGKTYAKDHNIPNSTSDLGQMLEDPDVTSVYISSTNEKHHSQALAAIAAGKHVLCEKPLAMSLPDAVEMVEAAKEAGVLFATNHHLRNAGSQLAIKDLIDAGTIGEVQSVRIFHAVNLPEKLRGWRVNNPTAGGGVIADIIVHDADTVRFHLNEDPAEVVAIADETSLGEGVEDSVMTSWVMPSGIMVQAHASFTHQFAETGIEFYGTKGSIRGRGIMTQRPVGSIELVDANGSKSISFSAHNLYERSARLFADAIAGKGQPAASGIDGLKSLAVSLAVSDAAESGTKKAVDYGGY